MTDKVISELYANMFDQLQIFENGRKQRHEIIRENDAEIIKIIGEDKFSEIDSFVGAETAASEQYGFVVGFKYAMQLLIACGGKNTAEGIFKFPKKY